MQALNIIYSICKLTDFDTYECPISPKTSWLFLEIKTSEGVSGIGEISSFGVERGILQALPGMMGALIGQNVTDAMRNVSYRQKRMVAEVPRILLSGIEQALIDIQSKLLEVPPMELLGGQKRSEISLYANINRGTVDRTPLGWSKRAQQAKSDGYSGIKMAPFDGVDSATLWETATRQKINHGLACVAAVREAVGPDLLINVDMHSRFNLFGAKDVIKELEPYAPYWVEMPIRENEHNYSDIAEIRAFANNLGIRIAGAELVSDMSEIVAMVKRGVQDVYLPDIRLCSGLREALAISHFLSRSNLEFSLHNPAGPILDVISQSTASVATTTTIIERQYQEHPLQLTLLLDPLTNPVNGNVSVQPRPGWGVELDPQVLERSVGTNVASVDIFGFPGAGPNS